MAELIDPKQFVIVRKRKKYRFALFHNSPLCYEYDAWDSSYRPDAVEIGAGNGQFAVELARRHPDLKYLAVDVKGDRLQNGAHSALQDGLENIRFLRARADQLQDMLAPHSLQQIWLTFPDPFPRRRSAGRRLTHPHFLSIYRTLLAHGLGPMASMYLKHDNRDFFLWSLEQIVADGWHIDELSFDLHESELLHDYKILTTYEKRWLSHGLTTNFVRATPEHS